MQTLPKIPLDKLGPIGVSLIMKGLEGSKHQDYDRTVHLSDKLYRPLATGEDQEHLYKRFNRRESDQDLKEVMDITQQVTPAWWNALATPARKVPGVKPVVNVISYDNDREGKDGVELEKELENFTADQDIDHYFGSTLVDEGLIDPNAFVLWTFENFDNRYERPDVLSTIVPSKNVWNFEYKGGELHWLLIAYDIQYVFQKETPGINGDVNKAMFRDGKRFLLYGPNEHIVFEQVSTDTARVQVKGVVSDNVGQPITWTMVDTSGKTAYFLKFDDNTLYSVRVYAQKSRRVPAKRLGYIQDRVTQGRTCVSLLQPAIPYFLKSIKAVRELDLTFALHAFPRRIEYRKPCGVQGCQGGHLPSGDRCAAPPHGCGGTGYTHDITTTIDHITLKLPVRKDDMIELDKMTHYDFPPPDGLKLMMENVDGLRVSTMRAVYNSDVFVRDQIEQTATAKVIDMQSVYDALQPLALWLASARTCAVYVFAAYKSLDQQGKMSVVFRYPRHFKFESTADLVTMRRAMKEAGVGQGELAQIDMDIADQVHVDDPRTADRVKTMAKFNPYAGKDDATVLSLMGQGGKTIRRNDVLWTNMEYIFDQAEVKAEDLNPPVDFYMLAQPKQRAIIEEIIKKMIEELDKQAEAMQPEPVKLGTSLEEDEAEGRDAADVEEDQPAQAA